VGAKALWKSLQAFGQYPDWLQIWPGHGAGSACGKGISAVPYSTLGYERLFNWAFKVKTEAEFVENVLAGQPEPPKYFAAMKRVNKEGPAILNGFHMPPRIDDRDLIALAEQPNALVVDTRPAAEFAVEHLKGTLNIPLNSSFVTWAGWLVPYSADLFLIVDEATSTRLQEAVRALALIGIDRVAGYAGVSVIAYAARRGSTIGTVPQITPDALAARIAARDVTVIDVRSAAEWAEAHLPTARHIPLGHLTDRIAEIPRDQPVIVQCHSGGRSAIAASLLQRLDVANVMNLAGGLASWEKEGRPVEAATLTLKSQ
jgi:hydroxyacylglutathione hydrolase